MPSPLGFDSDAWRSAGIGGWRAGVDPKRNFAASFESPSVFVIGAKIASREELEWPALVFPRGVTAIPLRKGPFAATRL